MAMNKLQNIQVNLCFLLCRFILHCLYWLVECIGNILETNVAASRLCLCRKLSSERRRSFYRSSFCFLSWQRTYVVSCYIFVTNHKCFADKMHTHFLIAGLILTLFYALWSCCIFSPFHGISASIVSFLSLDE